MAGVQLGLKVAFYIYPCLLFLTLLGVQSLQFYRNRHGEPRQSVTDAEQKKKAENTKRAFARVIWIFQFVLCLLLLASIGLAAREAVAGQDEIEGKVNFSFSAYLVRATLTRYLAFADTGYSRLLMSEFCSTS